MSCLTYIRLQALLVTSSIATSHKISEAVPQVGGGSFELDLTTLDGDLHSDELALSSSEEWRDRGQQLFVDKLFSEAGLCFSKAKLDWWAKVARTYHDRQLAARLLETGRQPGSAFSEIARNFNALAVCIKDMGDGKDSRILYTNAAECYATVPNHKAAANAFLKAGNYASSVFHYRMAGRFDKAIEVATTYSVNDEISEKLKDAAKVVYARSNDVVSLRYANASRLVWSVHLTSFNLQQSLETLR